MAYNKQIYLCESGFDALIEIIQLKSISYYKYKIYFRDLESCHYKFLLHNIGQTYAHSFDEAFFKLKGQLSYFKNCKAS